MLEKLQTAELLVNYKNTNIRDTNNIIECAKHLDNLILITSESDNKVYLPYKVFEIEAYMQQYPEYYSSLDDVIEKEFVIPLDYYIKHPTMARFRETYSLIRDREGKSIVEALNYAFSLMFKYDLNPTIIAACKTQEQLDDYIDCLENERLDKFNHFKIEFRINPLTV